MGNFFTKLFSRAEEDNNINKDNFPAEFVLWFDRHIGSTNKTINSTRTLAINNRVGVGDNAEKNKQLRRDMMVHIEELKGIIEGFHSPVEDTVKPVITLIGVSSVSIDVGDTYNDLGATAVDNADGDITADIVVTGTVDVNTAGVYTLNYNVSDDAGNNANEVSRTITVSVIAPVKAFPTAFGAGSQVTGGRGYGVFQVTNLNDSGSGSYRQAISDVVSAGGGNIVFTVSGAINLTSNLGAGGVKNLSVWGQSAPEGGISVANKLSGFYAGQSQTVPSSNIIIRFMRFRVDSSPLIISQYNGIETDVFVMEWANNYIIDHCSFSFGTDEAINHGNGENVTWQHNLVAENSKGMIMGQVAQQQGNFSFNSNLFTRCSHRFVNVEAGGRVDLMNNYIFNWWSSAAAPRGAFELNHVNNYFGTNAGIPVGIDLDARGFNYVQESWTPSIHASGNIFKGRQEDPNADNIGDVNDANDGFWRIRTTFGNNGLIIPAGWREATPYTQLGDEFTLKTALQVKADLPDNVGAHKRVDENGNLVDALDPLDTIYITSVKNEIWTNWELRDSYFGNLVGNSDHYDDYFATVGIVLNTHPVGYDTNNDGIPDVWTAANMPVGTIFSDISDNGYTYLERYMNPNTL